MPAIEVSGVSKTWGKHKRALDGVSFTVADGECLGVIGPNGAGKTTLFGCLLGLLRPDAGHVRIAGLEPDDLGVRAHTGYVPERLEFDPTLDARQLLALRLELLGFPKAARAATVETQLDEVGLAPEARSRPLRTFSRGMLQRLGLAHALLGQPKWLFLDEPTLGIDPEGAAHLRGLLGSLKARGVTVVINSHDLAHLERVCDRVVLLRAGQVAAIETLGSASAGWTLQVRWVGEASADQLRAATGRIEATVLELDANGARVKVTDEAHAARLVQALVQAGVAISRVELDTTRLERFFPAEPRA